eukprot:6208702-Pleurochrysis_carterae.AAC.2
MTKPGKGVHVLPKAFERSMARRKTHRCRKTMRLPRKVKLATSVARRYLLRKVRAESKMHELDDSMELGPQSRQEKLGRNIRTIKAIRKLSVREEEQSN